MNILIFTRSLPCHGVGGMENVAWEVIVGLAGRGHHVHIITTALPSGANAPNAHEGFSVQFLQGTTPGRYCRRWWEKSRQAYLELRERFRPNLILSISAGARTVLPLLNGTPSVMQVHGTSLGECYSKLRSAKPFAFATALKNLSMIPVELSLYRHFDHLVAVGPAVERALTGFPTGLFVARRKVSVIPNGVDVKRFHPCQDSRERLRGRFGLGLDTRLLLWVSRLVRQKGAHVAVEALRRLQDPKIKLLVVGDGPDRRELERMVCRFGLADRVIFAGAVSPAQMPAFYAAADAFVFTSLRDEGLPLNVLEAMACNLPCVVAERVVATLGLGADVPGLVSVDPANRAEVARGLSESIGGLSCATRQLVVEFFSGERMIDCYEELLKELV